MLKFSLTAFCFLIFIALHAVENPYQKEYNFFSFSHREKKIDPELESLTPAPFKSHPDFGLLPFDKPCENCIELEDHRDATSRYFIEKNSGGKRFYKQQSYGAINYRDSSGWWREINYRLKQQSTNVFEAPDQSSPVKIDMNEKFSSICNGEKEIRFNKNLELIHIDPQGKTTSLGTPDWNNFSAGDDGILVHNFYPGIDLQMIVFEGKIKTNFILHHGFPFQDGWIVMKQQLDLPEALHFDMQETSKDEHGRALGDILLSDYHQEYFRIHSSVAYDADPQLRVIKLGSEVSERNELLTFVPMNWLNDPHTVYPVVIDPTISVTATFIQSSITGSQYNPVCWTGGCTYSLFFTSPSNCTITDIRFSFDYSASGLCSVPDGGVSFNYGTCRSPATGAYTCSSGGTGTTCSFTNYSLFNDFASCIPPPQCGAYNMNFTMRFYRCNNDLTAGCSPACIAAASPWSITVTGETVRIQPGSFSANQLICEGDSVQLHATAEYGIAPYGFIWNPVWLTNDTITVAPHDTTRYKVFVSDACGVVAIDSVTVFVIHNNNPGFRVSQDPSCIGQTISLTGLGSGAVADYDWLAPGSSNPVINDAQVASVLYTAAGTDTITLNYSNGMCVFPSTQTVTINSAIAPAVNLSSNSPGIICEGDSIRFTALPANGGLVPAYQWWLNGTLVPGTGQDTLVRALQSPGINTIVVEITSDLLCATPASAWDTIQVTVTANMVPSVNVLVSPDDTACVGASLSFTAHPVNGGASPVYQWYVNGGSIGGNSSTFNSSALTNGAVITVSMISNATCAVPAHVVSNPLSVTLNPFVTPSVNVISVQGDTICAGALTTFHATPQNGGTDPSYQWSVNGAAVGSDSISFSTITIAEGDLVSVTMTSNEMCVTQAAVVSNQISMHTYAPVHVSANAVGTTCPYEPVVLNAVASGGRGGPYYYLWSDGAGSGSTVTVMPAVTTNYFVYATDICNSALANATVLVTVRTAPVAGYGYTPDDPSTLHPEVAFTDLSEHAMQWSWDFGDGETSVDQNPVHSFDSAGTYPVTLVVTDAAGCTDSVTFRVLVKKDFAFFIPNSFSPNGDGKNDTFTLLGSNIVDFEMVIFDRWGDEIFRGGPLNPWTGFIHNSNKPAPAGVYSYRINMKDPQSETRTITGGLLLIR